MKVRASAIVFLAALLPIAAGGACIYVSAQRGELYAEDNTSGWIGNRVDCICGLDDPRLLSHPARIDHARCLGATPELKKMRDENIDPLSPRGIQLTAQAVDRVRNAAEEVRTQHGHCSVWKQIHHRDGRIVPDRTAEVIAILPLELAATAQTQE